MTDTPQHVKDLQLKLWLAKTPGERLRQMLLDNAALYKFWKEAKFVENSDTKKVIITKEMMEQNSKNSK